MLQIDMADIGTGLIIDRGGVPPGPVVPTVVYSRKRYRHVRRIFWFAIPLPKYPNLSSKVKRLRWAC